MKLWIKSGYFSGAVHCFTKKPRKNSMSEYITSVSASEMSRLLRGTGKRLPKHGTDEIVEIEVTAR